jgi:hypothetical protein
VKVRVAVANRTVARALERAMAGAMRAAERMTPITARVVRLRTRKRLERLGTEGIAGAIAVVTVRERNVRRLPALVAQIRAAGPLGVQLVWDGHEPARAMVEQHVFRVLEDARSTPGGPPVVLAKSREPVRALRLMIAFRGAGS